jgi:hypothetical protein
MCLRDRYEAEIRLGIESVGDRKDRMAGETEEIWDTGLF